MTLQRRQFLAVSAAVGLGASLFSTQQASAAITPLWSLYADTAALG
jgi:hypothetical protein